MLRESCRYNDRGKWLKSHLWGEICHTALLPTRKVYFHPVSMNEGAGEREHSSHWEEIARCWPLCLCNSYTLWVRALNVFASSIFFPLDLNIQVPFMENRLPHGLNSLLLNLSKHYPIRFILSPENYLSFLYEAALVLLINKFSQFLVLHALQLCMCLRDLSLAQNLIPLNLSCRHYPDNSNISICAVQWSQVKNGLKWRALVFVCRQMKELTLNSLWVPCKVMFPLPLVKQ